MNRTERFEEADIEAIFERDRNKPPRYPLYTIIRNPTVEPADVDQEDGDDEKKDISPLYPEK